MLLLADGFRIEEWKWNICFYCGVLIRPSGRYELPLCQAGALSDNSDSCLRYWCGSRFDGAATHSTIPDLDHPNMYTVRLDCCLEGFICIFIRKKRRQQIFFCASRESNTKSLSPCVGVREQNIYFVFIPFLNCGLMCKSELRFQQGKSGFKISPKIQLAQSELSLNLICCCFFFFFFK